MTRARMPHMYVLYLTESRETLESVSVVTVYDEANKYRSGCLNNID